MLRRFKGWRTWMFNIIAALPILFDVIVEVALSHEVRAVLPPHVLPWYSLAVLFVNLLLRRMTTTPLGHRE